MTRSRCSSSSTIRSPVELPAKILMPQTPLPEFQPGKFGDVGLGAADVQAHVAPGDLLDVVLLPGELLGIDDGRRGVRHVEHRGQAAEHRGPACRSGWSPPSCRRGRADARADRSARAARAGPWRRSSRRPWRRRARRARRCGRCGRRRRWPRCPRAAHRCRCGSAGRSGLAWRVLPGAGVAPDATLGQVVESGRTRVGGVGRSAPSFEGLGREADQGGGRGWCQGHTEVSSASTPPPNLGRLRGPSPQGKGRMSRSGHPTSPSAVDGLDNGRSRSWGARGSLRWPGWASGACTPRNTASTPRLSSRFTASSSVFRVARCSVASDH